jgi:hypothetical protein
MTIEQLAKEILNLETLETRMGDNLDFHNIAVWDLKRFAEEVYNLGKNSK